MTFGRTLLGTGLSFALIAGYSTTGFSQTPAPSNRIPQQIIVNGQQANGAYVRTANGGIQSYKCPNPAHYTSADGASSGWTCYDQETSTYLLNALPPASTSSQTPAPVPVPLPAPAQTTPEPAPLPAPAAQPPMMGAPLPRTGPGPAYRFPRVVQMGNVKIDTKIKGGSIYIDGGYAGVIGKLKKFPLEAGSHDIEFRDPGGKTVFEQKIEVTPGRTIEVKPTVVK